MSETKRVGLSFGRRVLRVVVLSNSSAKTVLERAAEIELPFEIGPNQLLEASAVESLREAVSGSLEGQLSGEAATVVALPTDFCRVRLVPVDGELSEEEIQEQARWELGQAVVDDVTGYNFGVHRIRAEVGLVDRMIVVGVRKPLVSGVRRALAGVAGRLVSVESDVFSAARAFTETHPQDPVRPTILLGRRSDVYHAVFLKRNEISGYAAWPIGELAASEPTDIAAFVRDVIDRFLRAHEICSGLEEVAGIYMYGEDVGEELLEALRDTFEARVERLNPFQRQKPSEALRDVAIEARPEAFAAAFGAALW